MMIKVHSEREMEELGERVGRLLGPGGCGGPDRELGSGKTAFCRGLGRGLGWRRPSPA